MPDQALAERADAAAADRADYALELLERLAAEPSLEGTAAIEACLDHVLAEVEERATEVLRPVNDGLPNLIARFGGRPGAPPLAFSGHVDVVPADTDWTTPPFEPTRSGDLLRGRGVCDMKGGVAGFVAAIRAVDDAGLLEDCAIELVLTGDEEVGSRRGLIPLLERGLVTATAAVCGEPTGLSVFLGNRGLIWSEVAIRGRGGHAGQSHTLANPIDPAVALGAELAGIPLDARDDRFDPPNPSLTLTGIETGDPTINVVPDEVHLTLDRRLVPGEDVAEANRAIEAAVARVAGDPFEYDYRVRREWPPYAISADEPVALAAVAAARFAGRDGQIGMDLASNDSSWLDQAGIPTVLLGPGEPDQAHVTDETLHLDQLRDVTRIYAQMILAMQTNRGEARRADG
jgi:acetylornithine deacetylase/succinyl-diaminopimelate desuccinylase-like protein